LLRRRFDYHGKTRLDLSENCPENINWTFVSFVRRTRKASRLQMLELFDSAPASENKYVLRSGHGVAWLLAAEEPLDC